MTKVELYDLIKMHKLQCETFAIDGLLAKHGRTVIRLPPYLPDLNPIEKYLEYCEEHGGCKKKNKLQDIQ
jgi:hypothetical protein